jgi:hypothetical protein
MAKVHFGDSSEFVSIEFPFGFGSKGWGQVKADVAVRCFGGTITPWVEVSDLRPFLKQLAELHQSLNGSAEFMPLDQQLTLKIVGDGCGHMHLKGTAWSEARHGNRLDFELGLDQTFLSSVIAQLESILNSEAE